MEGRVERVRAMGRMAEGTGGGALLGFARTSSEGLRGVVYSSLYCITWEF